MQPHNNDCAKACSEIKIIAASMLAHEKPLLEGVRQIVELSYATNNPNHENFLSLAGVNSETDHIPLGAIRAHWNEEALKKKDEELRRYLDKAGTEILQICQKIADMEF